MSFIEIYINLDVLLYVRTLRMWYMECVVPRTLIQLLYYGIVLVWIIYYTIYTG
jgi:hypothetical protein